MPNPETKPVEKKETKVGNSEFPAIIDLSGYTEKMRKSFLDKTFFLEKLPDANVIFDYGCADGSMIEFMWKMFPEYRYFGFDIDPKMIALAKAKNISTATFSDDFSSLMKAMRQEVEKTKGKSVVVCSSIVHEIYSYPKNASPEIFWRNILTSGFDYVVIRDMAMPEGTKNYDVNADTIWKIARYFLNQKNDTYILDDFMKKWGMITTEQTLVHFLLKYRYKNNWERELNENYLPLSVEELEKTVTKYDSYVPIYSNNFTLPWLISKVKEDFDIDLDIPTHIKLILRKK